MRLVSAIIPSLHRPDLTARCLRALAAQTVGTEVWEAVVVENDARPKTSLAEPLPPNVRCICLDRNYGTTGSINRGAAACNSEYVLLLNNDIELHPEFLARLLAVLEHSNHGFATGKLLQGNNRAKLDGAGDAVLLGGAAYRLGRNEADMGQFDAPGFVLAGCGAATLFRRSVFAEVQGLDEDLFAYLDDVDLALRVQLAGYTGVYIPEAVAYHLGSATLGDVWHPKIVELLTRNQILLVCKTYPFSVWFRALPRILVFQALWFAVVAQHARLLPYVRGLAGVAMQLPRTMRKRRVLMKSRRLSAEEFLGLLRMSEKQICDWQRTAQPNGIAASSILRAYFALFPCH